MSTMLEQAVVDAKMLKDAALKNAENALLEKYSIKIKEAVENLLEQDDDEEEMDMEEFPMDLSGEEGESDVAEEVPLAATDDEKLCQCPEDEEEVEIDFGELEKQVVADDELESDSDVMDQDELADELEITEEEINEEDEEIDISEAELKDIVSSVSEEVKIDMDTQVTDGWSGSTPAEEKMAQDIELAKLQQEEEKKEEFEQLKKAVKESKIKLMRKQKEFNDKEKEYKEVVSKLQEKLQMVNLTNAKLLYKNKVLNSSSLNERQKVKLVKTISNAKSVEESKAIYEALLNSVGSYSDKKESESLSEVIGKKSKLSTFILSSRKESEKPNPVRNRMKILAGIK